MRILNLGCGTKVSSAPEVVNIDWSIYLRLRLNPVLRQLVPFVVRGKRLETFKTLPDNIMVHNLAKGIPFASDSADAVYHSHLLEHLDPPVARGFLLEVKRVLKPGGIQRIVVPDLEKACLAYVDHLAAAESDPAEARRHDAYIAAMIEQSVRKESRGVSEQPPVRRLIEGVLLGDARRRGETHQWAYDRVNLGALLTELGFKNVHRQAYRTSRIPDWERYGLDLSADGGEYKPESLYMEAEK